MSVRNGSQLTEVPWDLRLAGHTSATHTFLVFVGFLNYIAKAICLGMFTRSPLPHSFAGNTGKVHATFEKVHAAELIESSDGCYVSRICEHMRNITEAEVKNIRDAFLNY